MTSSRTQNKPVIKTLVTSLHDLLVCQKAELGQKRAAEVEMWDKAVSQHAAVMVLKDKAAKRALVLESSGASDVLKGTMADRLPRGQVRGLLCKSFKNINFFTFFVFFGSDIAISPGTPVEGDHASTVQIILP